VDRAKADIDDIFCEALERPSSAEQAAYLDQACRHDPALRRRVERLLEAHAQADSFLAAGPSVERPTSDWRVESGGTLIGPYKLLEQIGEGGFGVVFLAEQQEPIRRKVALKVLKPGMDTRQVVARFEAERQALALMDHSNIAKVLDAGTIGAEPRTSVSGPDEPLTIVRGSGRPYFVMELVKGVPITDYCDQNNLPVRERLDLFVTVCQAVQHAHQKGIIHRDIKPSNVLITRHDATPVVKVIDFGIAKAMGQQLTDKTLFTHFAQMLGTPLYMSPEQAGLSDLDVDTRSDIYSLGVLLYELLTGTTPFDQERFKEVGYDEMRRIIREEEPPRPSTRLSTLGQAASTASARRQTDPRRLSQALRGELDWVVMKCLEKDRDRRYETAAALAQDIERYLRDEPVHACPPSALYRFRKFTRRNKTRLAFTGLILFFLGLLGGGASWITQDNAARHAKVTAEVNQALQQAKEWRAQGKWLEARAALEQARAVLAGSADQSALQQRADELGQDLNMAMKLETIRLQPTDSTPQENLGGARQDQDFAEAFRTFGIDVQNLTPEEAADRIRARSIRVEIATALEDWALLRKLELKKEESAWKPLLAIARAADPDEQRNRFRDALATDDQKALEELAASDRVTTLPASALSFLGVLVGNKAPEHGVELLRRARRKYPDDFWINNSLAYLLMRLEPKQVDEAVRCDTTAVALRPHSPMAYVNLSIVLRHKGLLDEALAACHQADRLAPGSAIVQACLGETLKSKGLGEQAVAAFKEAVRLRPDYVPALYQLGMVFLEMDRLDEALAAFQETIRVAPSNVPGHGQLGVVLKRKGLVDKAIAEYREAIRIDPDYAIAHYNLGIALDTKQDFDQAIAELGEAIRCRPNFFEAHNHLGGVLLKAKEDVDGAIAAFRTAIRIKPDFAAAYNNLGAALERKQLFGPAAEARREYARLKPKDAIAHFKLGAALVESRQLDEAIRALQTAIGLDKVYAPAHGALGRALRLKGDLGGAVAAGREAIRLDARLASAYTELGTALTDKARAAKSPLDEAIVTLKKAVQLERDNPGCQYDLGVALGENGSWDEAIAAYREAVRLKPKFPKAWYNLGYNLEKKGLLDDAIVAFKEAIRLAPDMAEAHIHLGQALSGKGQLEEAVAAFKDALRCQPNHVWAYNCLGVVLRRSGHPDEAIAAFSKAVHYKPDYAFGHYGLGLALASKGDHESAIFAYRMAIHFQPDFVEAYKHLADELIEKRALDEALIYCREAVRLAPHVAGVRYTLARALHGKGENEEAIAHYREAIRLNPNFAQAHCNLGHLLLTKGKLTEALAAMKRGHELGSKNRGWRYPSAQWVQDYQRLVDLEAMLADIKQGKAKAKDHAERLELARFCAEHKQLYELSARWYAEAFAASPELAEDLAKGHRYNAARAAARAACSHGPDAAKLDDKGRARWRQQALDWLRADLALWSQRVGDNKPATDAAQKMLQRWLRDPDLASLRDEAALGNLPVAEQEACRQLWSKLRGLLGRVQGRS
jgi:tetratricopeptide (TPR) repeat protein